MKRPSEGQIIAAGGLIAAMIGSFGDSFTMVKLANRVMLTANLLVIAPAIWRYWRSRHVQAQTQDGPL